MIKKKTVLLLFVVSKIAVRENFFLGICKKDVIKLANASGSTIEIGCPCKRYATETVLENALKTNNPIAIYHDTDFPNKTGMVFILACLSPSTSRISKRISFIQDPRNNICIPIANKSKLGWTEIHSLVFVIMANPAKKGANETRDAQNTFLIIGIFLRIGVYIVTKKRESRVMKRREGVKKRIFRISTSVLIPITVETASSIETSPVINTRSG